ncbi:hypothetical protein Pan97_34150 [Bremerella volcania]|uniref:SLA1 homology domain-containing protein n=1 Tax=Bremerella volcania TaxID=2527984 RepID=A0A518CAW9_9BACT|nr:hypothetical protein [Bremerella volcania]QDU76367.1 hypothetical protein Pan97_34150 [Bremerella volcania]
MFRQPTDFWRYNWALIAVCAGLCLLSSAHARTWTTLEGKEVEAELVEVVQDGKAVILDVKGNRFTVPLERLSPKDRGYIQGLQDSMPTLSDAELQREIDEAVSEDERGDKDNEADPVRLKAKRIWRSREGVAVEAQFIRMVQGTIILREGARYHRIQFYDLSVDDRQFLADAHKAIGKAALIPPVRPDLLDAEPQTSDVPSYRDHPPVPSSPMPAPVKSPPAQTQVNLPDNGFGSASDNVKLPPGGFGAAEETTKLPPGGFGSPASSDSGSNVKLPPSGFGTPSSSSQVDSSSDSTVKLPSGGFGSVGKPSEVTEDHGSFSSVPTPSSTNSGKVGVPSSTITDNSSAQSETSERPLFDVASVPSRSNGFGSATPADSSGSPQSPDNMAPTSPTSTTGTPPTNGAKTSSPNSGSNTPSVSDEDFKTHTYTPSSDFSPLQTVEDREFTTADWNLQMFGVMLLALGSLMIAGGYLWLIALAFLESLEVGLRSLIPGMAIVQGFSDTEKSSVPLLGMLLGICLTLGGFGLLMGVS